MLNEERIDSINFYMYETVDKNSDTPFIVRCVVYSAIHGTLSFPVFSWRCFVFLYNPFIDYTYTFIALQPNQLNM